MFVTYRTYENTNLEIRLEPRQNIHHNKLHILTPNPLRMPNILHLITNPLQTQPIIKLNKSHQQIVIISPIFCIGL